MKIAVLFDGAGLARLGLERAGHICTGFELDPIKHKLSTFVGSGNCILQDATKVNLNQFDAVWASPPCQLRSSARTQGSPISNYANDYLSWCLKINNPILWVENILSQSDDLNRWGSRWNAAQFTPEPLQNRNRIIGGRHKTPKVFRKYKKNYPEACHAILATEYKASHNDQRRASRFFGERLSLDDCAHYQGFTIPFQWKLLPLNQKILFEAVGNGVPVYMSRAFGEVHA